MGFNPGSCFTQDRNKAPYVFELGSSSDLSVGDRVFAIGSPLGLDKTLTSGIISSDDRHLFSAGFVFQIDAAVNSGNSGGPLIDEKGRVQAVVFAGVMNYQGLNFAIPVEYLRYDLPFLLPAVKENIRGAALMERQRDFRVQALFQKVFL